MSPVAILKLLKAAKEIKDYVKKPNNLDMQLEMVVERLKQNDEKIQQLEIDIKAMLEMFKKQVNKEDWWITRALHLKE